MYADGIAIGTTNMKEYWWQNELEFIKRIGSILAFLGRRIVIKTWNLFNLGKFPLFVTKWANVSCFQPTLNAI